MDGRWDWARALKSSAVTDELLGLQRLLERLDWEKEYQMKALKQFDMTNANSDCPAHPQTLNRENEHQTRALSVDENAADPEKRWSAH